MRSVLGSRARFPWSPSAAPWRQGCRGSTPTSCCVISDSSRSYKCVTQTPPRPASSRPAPPRGGKPWDFSPGTFVQVGSLLSLDTAAACRRCPLTRGGRVRVTAVSSGRYLCPIARACLTPSRDSLEPSPGAGLLKSSGAFAEGAALVFGAGSRSHGISSQRRRLAASGRVTFAPCGSCTRGTLGFIQHISCGSSQGSC